MAYTTPRWVRLWLTLSSFVVLWDAGYCFNRPRSMRGGDLSWIWGPYNMVPYSDIDLLYGFKVLEEGDGFTNAQSALNLIEVLLNFVCVLLGNHPGAPVIGFAAVVMTASKTILYFLQEYFCGWCMTGHNDRWRFWTIFVATNGMWILVPTIASIVLGAGLIKALTPTSYGVVVAHKSKKQDEKKNPSPLDADGEYPIPNGGAPLPLTFHVRGLPVLVVGSNRLVASRVLTLLEAEAQVTVSSGAELSTLPEEVQWRVSQGQIKFKRFVGKAESWETFLSEKKIALVCVTDTLIGSKGFKAAEIATAIHRAATSLCIPINVSDQRSMSTFTFPSVHRFSTPAGPSNLQVAVSTNGHGCRLAGRIRRDIAARLPSNVGAAVDNIGMLRARANGSKAISEDDLITPLNAPINPSADEDQLRRMRWVHQMSEYYSYDQLAGMSVSTMENALDSSASGDITTAILPHHDNKKGRILLVGSGPGHPSLLTVAARYALENATLILSDKLVPAEIIALIPKTTKLHIARKFPGNADGAQNELMELAIAGAQAGETVVRLKQGDPFVYGRGGEEVLYFRERGYEAIVVPGVSSALAGPLMNGIPVTQRGVADSLVMCTGVGRAGSAVQLPGYVKSRTLAILMGVARIEQVLEVLTADTSAGRDGTAYPRHLPIAIVERASSPDQRVILSTLENIGRAIASVDQRPPGMILVGWAAMCLEGKGQVDVLDDVDEHTIVDNWLAGKQYKTREGLPSDWSWFGSL